MSDPSPAESGTNAPDVLQQTWQALTAGQVVALPTETGYVLAAHLGQPNAVVRLAAQSQKTGTTPFLAVRGATEVQSLLPTLSGIGLRLCRRFWPGPVLVRVPEAEPLLASRLSRPLVDALCPAGSLDLRLPASDLLLHLLPVLGGPAVLLPVPEPSTDAPDEERCGAARMQAFGLDPDLLAEGGAHAPRPICTVVEIRGTDWEILVPGPLTRESMAGRLGCVIAFICTGNTCRSPLAEALCKKRLADRLGCRVEELPTRGFFVLSAGLSAMMGQPAAEEAVAVARQYGADLSAHQSRPLGEDLACQADFLLGMTRGHLYGLDDGYPHLGTSPRLVRPDGTDIADPIGQSRAVYEECARQIWEALEPLIDEILPASREGRS